MNKGFKSLKTVDLEHGAVCRAFSYAKLCTFIKGICIIEHHMHAMIQFFARKEMVKNRQIMEREDREATFAQLQKERAGR